MEIATDVTDRRNMEELNSQQSERLQQTSRVIAMGEMASSLAHELNQPLAAIANYNMGCVNRLQANDYRPEELLAAMQKATAQADRAGKIIRRVRDFVKKSEPRRGAVQIDEVIEEIIGFAEIEARKAGVRISISVPPGLPAVYADKIMIEQVVLNLVKNGIEAMLDTPRAERELAISARANGKDFIEVKVADRGHGVLVESAEKLFVPFYTTKPEGMGMGLNICRSIIEFHHGRLWTVAHAGGGTVFSFTLPVNPR
jgi:C4-dicarboxylate-specific signal transduction histidine kinase